MMTHSSILLIEDSPGECELFRLALAQIGLAGTLYTEQDAEAAFHFLEDRAHQNIHWYFQARSFTPPAGGLTRSPAARIEGALSYGAPSASTGDRSGLPSVILLDLHLRGQDGCNLLKRLRSDPRFATIPTIIFTTSDDQHDLARCYASGANGYVVKPGTFAELVQFTHDICRYWLTWNRSLSMVETQC